MTIQYKPLPFPQTVESARDYFYRHGITVSGWAQAMKLNEQSVKDILCKRSIGRSGKAHFAAVALGLKKAPKK